MWTQEYVRLLYASRSESVLPFLVKISTDPQFPLPSAFRCRVSSVKLDQTLVLPFLPQETSRLDPNFGSSLDLHPSPLSPFLRRSSPVFLRFSPFLARRNLYEMSTFGSDALSSNVSNDGSRRVRNPVTH